MPEFGFLQDDGQQSIANITFKGTFTHRRTSIDYAKGDYYCAQTLCSVNSIYEIMMKN